VAQGRAIVARVATPRRELATVLTATDLQPSSWTPGGHQIAGTMAGNAGNELAIAIIEKGS
jgi:hypothetical protein